MADKGALQEIQEKLKEIGGKVAMLAVVYIILVLIAFVLCSIIYFKISYSPNSFVAGKETFRTKISYTIKSSGETFTLTRKDVDGTKTVLVEDDSYESFKQSIEAYIPKANIPEDPVLAQELEVEGEPVFILQTSIYQFLEHYLLGEISSDGKPNGGIRKILYDLRHNVLFNLQFRTLAVMIAVLATALMGLSMLTGDQKITIKEFAMDVLVIFGTTGLLLSQNVEMYIDFFYGIITASASWIIDLSMNALFKVTAFKYADPGVGTVNVYAPLDVVASMFFDSEIAPRVRIKLVGMLFGGPSFMYTPVMVLCMLYALIATINVFLAFVMAKVTILFALQVMPFLILFTAINDVKIKLTKGAKSKSFLWNLIDVGIMKPWIYLALMSFAVGLLFYFLVLKNIEDIFNFSVYVTPSTFDWIKKIPIIGKFLSTIIHNSFPRPSGLDHATTVMKLISLIFGLVAFKYAFDSLTQLVHALSFSLSEGGNMSAIFGNISKGKRGVYSKGNMVGGLVNPAVDFVQNNALKYTMGYNAKKSNFDQKHKSLRGGFKSQRRDIKKFFTGKSPENKNISSILNNKELTEAQKKNAIIKELKKDVLLQDDMRDYYGTKIERNFAQKGKDWVREGLGGDKNSNAWYGRKQENSMGLYDKKNDKYLKITDKHYEDYAERLLQQASENTQTSSPSSPQSPSSPSPSSPSPSAPSADVENAGMNTTGGRS